MSKKDFYETTDMVRQALTEEFEGLKKERIDLTEADLDFYLARDRKAALILKTLDMDIKKENLEMRRKPKQKQLVQ